jgi:hypothetical protein
MCISRRILATGVILCLAYAQNAGAQQFMPQYGNMSRAGTFTGGGVGSYGGYSPLQSLSSSSVLNPYLNLVRGANTPALNLFLGTYSEIDRRNFQAGVASALPPLEAAINQGMLLPYDLSAIPTLPQTGHLSAFQAYGSFYNYGNQQRPFYPLNPYQARSIPR